MNNNVYSAPNASLIDYAGIHREEGEKILAIAYRQKHLLYCFLVYLIFAILFGAAPPDVKPLIQILAIPLFITIVIFTARLSLKVYNIAVAVIMILLSIIPLFNILVILAASSRATKAIKSAGFKVGFMGTDIKQIETALKG